MDRLIYTALSGAKAAFQKQEVAANNLANASTSGFRAELQAFRPVPVDGAPARTFALMEASGPDFSAGPVQRTGRDLDVAIEGPGWFAVEGSDGSEAYTRGGALVLDDAGALRTASGRAVLGDGGPISVPANAKLSIAQDGTISAVVPGPKAISTPVARIKLVNPDTATLERGTDGLFRVQGGGTAEIDEKVKLASGSLEGSNVNPVEAMVSMIAIARQFEIQMKLLTGEEANAREAAKLLNISA